MNKEEYTKIITERWQGNAQKILLQQVENFFNVFKEKIPAHNYNVGDSVVLKKRTLLHGTFKKVEEIKDIAKYGLIANLFDESRKSKYSACVSTFTLNQDYVLSDYINYYSGGTLIIENSSRETIFTKVIPLEEMKTLGSILLEKRPTIWDMQQTKESRFLPSLTQKDNQLCFIFDYNPLIDEILKYDILNGQFNNEDLRPLMNASFYNYFVENINKKDDTFTNRESAILFGVSSNFISGLLVGRDYENNSSILDELKTLFPTCYICNLDGKVIRI